MQHLMLANNVYIFAKCQELISVDIWCMEKNMLYSVALYSSIQNQDSEKTNTWHISYHN